MRALLLAAALAAPAAAQIPDGAVFATTEVFCDCDPQDFVFRTRRAVEARARPRSDARVVRTVEAGRLVEGNDWSEARTVVRRPARLVLPAEVTFAGVHRIPAVRDADGYWRPRWERAVERASLTLAAGTPVRAFAGETGGAYFAVGDVLYFDDDFWFAAFPDGSDEATGEAEPAEELWLHLRPRGRRPAAWVEIGPGLGPDGGPFEMVCGTHAECPPGVGDRRR